jgi:hypothetical protein
MKKKRELRLPFLWTVKVMIISVHLPKTAGISFLKSLELHFSNRLLKDYADMPINTPVFSRNQAALRASLRLAEELGDQWACVHGHFMPLKYLLFSVQQPSYFVTWMRNPVDRIVSHYYFWYRNYNPAVAGVLHRRVVEEQWSLEKFVFSPEVRNLYTQFLWGFPLERFDFIGITEHYAEDFTVFTHQLLKQALPEFQENRNTQPNGHYALEAEFRQQISLYHQQDMDLYARAVAYRNVRLKTTVA